ncbi:hypothetical protein A9W99_18640 [Mycobacterium sp. 1164966.3]|uniref:hypothetical protein n=1 Tax=Mycobacterium sp. 1164966.3 TaxID=1856861 RepID=UPI0007FCFEE2|nr:hypothetical protein [Mycobacterium sp. 1164966.3]OBA80115.1 hypothetical protein A9W99_18640 [Mycobacterium sp. 1164966.3]
MANPFEKRATEYLVDTEAFLAVVTPEPVITFFERHARNGSLYDRLAIVTGTPGSGKTTLARLFEYSTVQSLVRHRDASTYRSLSDALTRCAVLTDLKPQILGARVPLESEYREFWEFPYPDEVRTSLTTTLVQARAVIRWLRQLGDAGTALEKVTIQARTGAEAALEQIGGRRGDQVLTRARDVERAIYKIVRALVPPKLDTLAAAIGDAYHPFDVIERINVPLDRETVSLIPLAIFDDAHSLHPVQYERIERWLAQREMRVGRWILTRLDALKPAHVLGNDSDPAMQRNRVITDIRMQPTDRKQSRPAFRKMAKDMSSRYLAQMDTFNRRRLTDLADLLATDRVTISDAKLAELEHRVDVIQRRVGASDARRAELVAKVEQYLDASKSHLSSPELVLAATAIVLERYGKRTPQLALDVFVGDEIEPNKPITVDASLIDGARIRLLHDANVPYYVGFDALCDASTENAEQFLQLASRLVAQAETQLVRGKQPTISIADQHRLITKKAVELIDSWDFPHHREVRRLTNAIAAECLDRSLEGNASLGGGANAWGVPQEDFDELPRQHADLARVLQYAVAYNAVVLKPKHSTKGREWCLIELGGPVTVSTGLTLKRGGFLEREVDDMLRAVGATRSA